MNKIQSHCFIASKYLNFSDKNLGLPALSGLFEGVDPAYIYNIICHIISVKNKSAERLTFGGFNSSR